MTAKTFQKVNGCVPRLVSPGEWEAVDENGTVRASCKGVRDIKRALFIMSSEVYRQNRMIVFERDGWRCVRCGSMRNLHCHHKVHRGIAGTNRSDDPAGMETLCSACHEKAHGGR